MSDVITRVEVGDAAAAARILAVGFGDDPVMAWLFEGDDEERALKLAVFYGFLAPEAYAPLGHLYVVGRSCACWAPPGVPDWPEERGVRFIDTVGAVASPTDLSRLAALGRLLDEQHPSEPHWYLGLLASEPDARGQGAGGALLADRLAAVDAEGSPAYLESTNPRNVSLYERHGFEATGVIELPDGPPMTAMWRSPR